MSVSESASAQSRASFTVSPDATPHGTHDYADRQLNVLFKELRAAVRDHPAAKQALGKVETRLRAMQRVISAHDAHHAATAEALLAERRYEAASNAAWLVWGYDARSALLRQIHAAQPRTVFADDTAVARNLELDREVLV